MKPIRHNFYIRFLSMKYSKLVLAIISMFMLALSVSAASNLIFNSVTDHNNHGILKYISIYGDKDQVKSRGSSSTGSLFENITVLNSFSSSQNTGEKPQSKAWFYNGTWWAVMPNSSGTWVWRLEPDNSWTSVLQLSSSTGPKADVKAVGSVSHILLHSSSPSLVSIEHVSVGNTYQMWTQRPSATSLSLPSSEIATIDIDSTGRMWLAADSGTNINVYHSTSPYTSFSGPITLANNVNSDDISAVIAMPNNRIGVMWSNQTTQRFGFRIRNDADPVGTWSADEVPASQSAQNQGGGMADDHINLKVASDGTLYAAVKTSYDSGGQPAIALLVRRPGGTWDDLYSVSTSGTRAIMMLNEAEGKIQVVYTSSEGSGNIIYRESPAGAISFGPAQTLISGSLNNASSTKANWSNQVVVLAASSSQAHGVLVNPGLETPTPGLVGHWRMDEGSGTQIIDSSGNGNHGTLGGTPNWSTDAKGGRSLNLNGAAGNCALVGNDASLGIPSGVTMAAWIKPGTPGTQYILKKRNQTTTNQAGYELSLANGGTVFARFGRGTGSDTEGNGFFRVDSTSNYPTNNSQWMHVAATWDGSIIRMYINGVQEATRTFTGPVPNNSLQLGVGCDSNGTTASLYNGLLDDVRLYNTALPASEILSLATNNAPAVDAGIDHGVVFPAMANLTGVVTDDNQPSGQLTSIWSKADGPGTVAFGNASQPITTASFSEPGEYILRLTASDGSLQHFDEVTITVHPEVGPPVLPDPIGHWRMDEGSGSQALDSSGNNNHGTLVNNPSRVAGKVGSGALQFNGTNQRVRVPDSNVLDVTGPMTMMIWVNPSRVETQHLFKKGTGNTGTATAYEISLASDTATSRPFARFGTSTSFVRIDADDPYPTGVWTHIAVVHTGTQVKMYINGVEQADIKSAEPINPTAHALGIGARITGTGANDADNFLQGQLDDARLYGVALTKEQIDQIINTAPVVNAGADQEITLPDTADLSGTVTDDGLPMPSSLTTEWSVVGDAPGTVTFGNALQPITTASFSGPGTYVLRLTASDGPLQHFDEVTITVLPEKGPVNTAPVVNAGSDQTIISPGPANLLGTVKDDGLPDPPSLTTVWSVVGTPPGTVTFGNTLQPITTASFSSPGTYTLRLTANDGELTAFDDVVITVDPVKPQTVGFWQMDENGGTQILDASGLGNHGNLQGNATWSSNAIEGYSLDLDGTGDCARVPHSSSLNITGAITMAAWVRPEKYATQDIIVKGTSGTDGYELVLASDSSTNPLPRRRPFVRFNRDTSGETFRVNSSVEYPINGTWMHVAATYDGTTMRIYVNGVETGSGPGPASISPNTLPLGIGCDSNVSSGREFQGRIDNAKVFGQVLSPGQIQRLANRPPTVDAGPDQAILLPANSVNLSGTANDDGLPSLPAGLTAQWSLFSHTGGMGPGTVTFGDPNALATTATFSVYGTYVLRLIVDDGHLTAFDDVTITVHPPATSASVSVGGRVLTAGGGSIRGATVVFTDMEGNIKTAVTNVFGYYRIDGLTAGRNYVVAARARGYVFEPEVLEVTESLSSFNIFAEN